MPACQCVVLGETFTLDDGTDACATHKVNVFTEVFAGGWRIESEVGNVFALAGLVLLMQLVFN